MKDVGGKVIWVTGASSGIGAALVDTLAAKNCKLIISARSEDKLLKIKESSLRPDDIAVLPLDLADFDRMPAHASLAIAAFGHIDVLINNAGISQRSLIAETDFEVYRRLTDINYLGTIALTKAILPHFVERQRGHYVTVSSLMGKFGSPYRSGYCGAKHALHGFFDVLRMEHERDGVDVTLICPGFVQTDVAKNALTADGSAQTSQDKATAEGMSVDTFAQKMIRAIEKKKYEAYIGGSEVGGIYLKRFFPRMLHRVVMRSQFR